MPIYSKYLSHIFSSGRAVFRPTSNRYIPTKIIVSFPPQRNFSTSSRDVVTVNVEQDYYTLKSADLLQYTSSYWRILRCVKLRLSLLNIDKAVQGKVMDVLYASGINGRIEDGRLDSPSSVYINIDRNFTHESILKGVKDVSTFMDVTDVGAGNVEMCKKLLMCRPTVIRFSNGTLDPFGHGSRVQKCKSISEEYGAIVVDFDEDVIVTDNLNTIILPKFTAPLEKMYGYNYSIGAIISATLPLSGDPFISTICSIIGVTWAVDTANNHSSGPGTLYVNLLDNLNRLSSSPDIVKEYKLEYRFVSR